MLRRTLFKLATGGAAAFVARSKPDNRKESRTMTKPKFESAELYDRYAVKIRIRERLDGGVPKSPELIGKWVAARTGHDDEQTKELVEEHMPDLDPIVEGVAEGMWTGFKRDESGHYIEARQVKAMLRESAVLLGIIKKKRGSRQIIQHGFEVRGHEGGSKIYLEACSEIETEERPIHVMTPQGPRSAIKRTDFVTTATLSWELWVLTTDHRETRHVGVAELEKMLTHSQENGLGANRSQGSGKFDVIEFGRL